MTFSEAVEADLVRGEAFRLATLDAGALLPTYAITDGRVCLAFTDDVDQTLDADRWALGRLNDQ